MTYEIQKWELILPAEANEYCLFEQNLENDPLVFFHATPRRYCDSIITSGFLSAVELGIGKLTSVSYAKRSSGCLAHTGNKLNEDYIVFAVKFDPLAQKYFVDNPSDIHIYKREIQPCNLGFCELPKGFQAQ